MADQNTIEKVYDLSIKGGEQSYATLEKINDIFIEIKKNKQGLGANLSLNIDSSNVDKVNKSLTDLTGTTKGLSSEIKILITDMGKLSQVGQQTASGISAGMAKFGSIAISNANSFAQLNNAMSGNVSASADYITIIGQLVQRHTDLAGRISSVQSEISRYEKQIKNTENTMAEYGVALKNNAKLEEQFNALITENTDKIGVLRVELTQLRSQASEVGGAINTMNKAWNPALVQEETEALAKSKVELAENNMELKQQAKLAAAAAGSMEAMGISLGLMRWQFRKLSEEERNSPAGQTMRTNIQKLDATIKELDKSIGNSHRNVGNYSSAFENMGGKLVQFVVRDLFRAAAGFIVFTALFEGANYLWDEAFHAEEKAAEKADKLRQANDELAQSFKSLTGELEIYAKQLQIDADIEKSLQIHDTADENETTSGYGTTTEGLKRKIEDIRALGVVKGEVYEAEKKQLEANQELRRNELEGLNTEKSVYGQMKNLLDELSSTRKQDAEGLFSSFGWRGDGTDKYVKTLKAQIDNSFLPDARKDDLKAKIDKAKKDKADINKVLEAEDLDFQSKQMENRQKIYDKEHEISNADVEFQSKHNALIYAKNTELYNQLIQLDDQYRQLKHKDDIASVDKIVKDTEARYKLMMEQLKQSAVQYAKTITEVPLQFKDKEKTVEDFDSEYNALPADIRKKFDAELAKYRRNKDQDEANQKFEQHRTEFFTQEDALSNEAAGRGIIAKGIADGGAPNYENMVDALDKQTEAKKEAARVEFEKLSEQYRAGGLATSEIEKQFQDKLKGIDAAAYAERLHLATDYFQKLADHVSNATEVIVKNIDTDTAQSITAILRGKESQATKAFKIETAEQEGIIKRATAEKSGYEEQLPGAEKTVFNDQDELKKHPEGSGAHEAAKKQLEGDSKILATLKNNIAEADKAIAGAQDKIKNRNEILYDTMRSEAISAFHEIGNAYVQMLAQQAQSREREAQQQLDWNKKVLDSQVQSNQQKTADDKAYAVAQRELEKRKFEDQKKLAEAQLGIDFATAVMSTISANAKLGPLAPEMDAIMIGALTSVYATKLGMIQAQQFGAGGEVPNNGGVFGGRSHSAGGTPFLFQGGRFEAEAGELAIINKNSAASNQRLNVSGTPKQIASAINAHGGGLDFAPGATMHRFEWQGSLGAQLQPPQFIGEYYTQKAMEAGNQLIMHRMITANTDTLNQHAIAMQNQVEAIHNRIDNIKVSLDHRDVTAAQNKHGKSVSVGSYGGNR